MHVPGWHAKLQEARDSAGLRMLGIVQEQHAERARLFKQWQGLDWPIVADPFGYLEVTYVPILVGVDEWGVIRHVWPAGSGIDRVESDFLGADFARPDGDANREPPVDAAARASWSSGGEAQLDDVITRYEKLSAEHAEDGTLHFRLGVAYRMRHDSVRREANDFRNAARAWTRALELDPNNYIWRRRLQQYGPRSSKPYPFYDWVAQARGEILARGETPVALRVEPGASEVARPGSASAPAGTGSERDPDPGGQIHRDPGMLIQAETTSVPARVRAGGSARVYVSLRPKPGSHAHWNNEVDDLLLWVEAPEGWAQGGGAHVYGNPKQALSREERVLEIDVVVPDDAASGSIELPAHALYYVCEDAQGACLYRRQDLTLRLDVGEATALGGR